MKSSGHIIKLSLLLGPALLIFVLFFAFPLLYMTRYSFSQYDPFQLVVPTFTLENYVKFFTDGYVWETLLRTVRLSVFTVITTVILGYPVAYYMWLRAHGSEKMVLAIIVLLPMMTSHVILGYAWMVLIAPNTGTIAQLLRALGLLSGPLQLMYTEPGILLGLTHYTLVFMVLNLHSALESIDLSHLRAASILGASPLRTFLKVTLPLSLPGVFSGCLLVFAISSSLFMIPFLLGGRRVPVLAVYAYDLNNYVLNWPLGATAGLILLVISGLSVFFFGVYIRRLSARLGMGN